MWQWGEKFCCCTQMFGPEKYSEKVEGVELGILELR